MSVTPIIPKPEITTTLNNTPTKKAVELDDFEQMISKFGLGAIVTVEYHKFSGNGWTPEQIKDALKKVGLTSSVVSNINPTTAIADTRASFRGVKTDDGRMVSAEITHRDPQNKLLTIALLSRDVQDKRSKWTTFDTLEFDYKQWIFTLQGTTPAAAEFRNRASHRLTHYMGGMFSKQIINGFVFLWNGFNYDAGGKNKYIPQMYLDEVNKLKEACLILGGVKLKIANQLATPDSKESIGDMAKSTLQSKIEWCNECMAAWKLKKKIRTTSQDNVFAEMEKIASQMVVLKDSLEIEVSSLEEHLEQLRSTALLLVEEKNATIEASTLKKLMSMPEFEIDAGFWVIPFDDFPFNIKVKNELIKNKELIKAANEMDLMIYHEDNTLIVTSKVG